MNDQDIIQEAYEDTVKQLFAVFFDASITTKDPGDQSQTEQRFQAGIRKAREVRDKAIVLLS